MQRKRGICNGCGNDRIIYAKKLCQSCYAYSRIPIYLARKKEKILNNSIIDKIKLQEFFKEYWDKYKKRECYECGIPLYNYRNWHLHHVIPKRFWKNYKTDIVFNEDNIVYVCLDCHSDADHNAMKNTPKIEKLYNELKEKIQ